MNNPPTKNPFAANTNKTSGISPFSSMGSGTKPNNVSNPFSGNKDAKTNPGNPFVSNANKKEEDKKIEDSKKQSSSDQNKKSAADVFAPSNNKKPEDSKKKDDKDKPNPFHKNDQK